MTDRAVSPMEPHDSLGEHAAVVRQSAPDAPERRRTSSISVVVPMLNEAEHVANLVADIASQDYEGEIELLVADGGSTDGSTERLRDAARDAGVPLTIIANPKRWVSTGLNACIRRANGDLIVRLDCHSRHPRDYVRRLVTASDETGAWQVGGLVIPTGRTSMERAVACATDSPFGGAHWTRHSGTAVRVDVDTVSCGAYRRETFDRAGLFDESLVRNQDDELALRIWRSGGSVVLDPDIRQYYVPRGSLRSVFTQYHEYGLWKVPIILKHRRATSARSLAPLGLVGTLAILGVAGTWSRRARVLLAAEVATYAAGSLVFGTASIRKRKEQLRLLPRVIAVFPALHVGFGTGIVRGCLRALRRP